MPGYFLQVGAKVLCPHGGQVQFVPATPRVKSGGMPLLTLGDMAMVVGCPNTAPPCVPCTMVKWIPGATGAKRVKIAGQPALLPPLLGTWNCVPPMPAAPATLVLAQLRVKGQ